MKRIILSKGNYYGITHIPKKPKTLNTNYLQDILKWLPVEIFPDIFTYMILKLS